MKKRKVNNLEFNKNNIVELNNSQLNNVIGGTFSGSFSGPLCDWIIDKLTNPLQNKNFNKLILNKTIMKTQSTNNLSFCKTTLVELTTSQLQEVNGGGTTFTCGECVLIPTLRTR